MILLCYFLFCLVIIIYLFSFRSLFFSCCMILFFPFYISLCSFSSLSHFLSLPHSFPPSSPSSFPPFLPPSFSLSLFTFLLTSFLPSLPSLFFSLSLLHSFPFHSPILLPVPSFIYLLRCNSLFSLFSSSFFFWFISFSGLPFSTNSFKLPFPGASCLSRVPSSSPFSSWETLGPPYRSEMLNPLCVVFFFLSLCAFF